jgi:hypothetical protein
MRTYRRRKHATKRATKHKYRKGRKTLRRNNKRGG